MGKVITSKAEMKEMLNVPRALIYEEIDGQPIFYRDYKDVINGYKTLEDIMGSSSIQGLIISLVLRVLFSKLRAEAYTIITNEIGLHLSKGNNLASDIIIYNHETIKGKKYDNFYFNIPPQIAIEVDTKADFSDETSIDPSNYYHLKTQKLLSFGIGQVIWIFTQSRMVMTATPQKPWLTQYWDHSILLPEGIELNIHQLLEEGGYDY